MGPKRRIASGPKKENTLASTLVLDCSPRAVGNLYRAAAIVDLPLCLTRDDLALLGHVDHRKGGAHKNRGHHTAAVFLLVHAQPNRNPWNQVVQTWGIGLIETLGPYLLARCYIRDADDFYNLIQLQFRIVLLLLPFAIVEFITGHDIWRGLFAAICASKSWISRCRREGG